MRLFKFFRGESVVIHPSKMLLVARKIDEAEKIRIVNVNIERI